ncbi:MAG TPA: hypothetical protein VF286_12010, partial [Acidiphilium sp.]
RAIAMSRSRLMPGNRMMPARMTMLRFRRVLPRIGDGRNRPHGGNPLLAKPENSRRRPPPREIASYCRISGQNHGFLNLAFIIFCRSAQKSLASKIMSQ